MKILKIDLSCLNQSLESPEGQSEEFSAKLSKSLGSLLRYIFSEQISPEFFEGISAAQNEEDINKDEFKSLQFFETLREQEFSSSSRRKSQIESLQFFRKAASQANVEILITNKLCIKTLKKTDSSKFISAKTKNISAHYKIYDIYGNILHGSFTGEHPLTVDLWGLIPGLVHGLLGMKEGEIREIYIHPDFAYGTDSNFAGGKSFLVQMELIKIDEESATSLPSLHPIDAEYVAPYIESSNAFETMQKRYNYFCGYKIWSHYKKAVPLLQLNLIQEELLKTQPYSLAEEERVKLAMLSWLIYHNPSCYPELPP